MRLRLTLANLKRRPVRTALTGFSLITAFLLFGLLEPMSQMFETAAETSDTARWWVSPRHSISDMLPVRYREQVSGVQGVENTAHITWFGGTYIDAQRSSAFTRWVVTPEAFLDISPDIVLADAQRDAFINTPTGAIVGRQIAERFNLNVGDQIPLTADIWHNLDGSDWHFDLVGIYDSPQDETDTTRMFINYRYFDEYRIVGKGLISNVLFTTGSVNGAEVAKSIDVMFANSESETRTQSESDYILSQVGQIGNISFMLRSVTAAVLFTILLLTGNTMAQAIRERRNEYAALRAMGFSAGDLLALTFAEAVTLITLAAGTGMLIAALLLTYSDQVLPQSSGLNLGLPLVIQGIGIAILLAVIVTLPPAIRLLNQPIADSLRRQ